MILVNMKDRIRNEILEKRNSIAEEERIIKSSKIFSRLVALHEFAVSDYIMAYMDFNGEVLTGRFIRACLSEGKRVLLPAVVEESGEKKLIPYEIWDIDRDLQRGSYGIMEPAGRAVCLDNMEKIGMVVVPGVAFGSNMHRLGYGAGYYDRFLAGLQGQNCLKAGVGFDIQVIDTVPVEPHDMPLDVIITESGIIGV